MLSFDLILVIIVLLFIIVSLYLEILGPAFTFMIGVIILGVFGILTPYEILQGFANEQVAVVILLLIIGDIIRKTAVMELIFDRLFRYAKSRRGFLSRMVILISGFSAFLNNTPLVAVMIPYVHNWCRKNNISPSKFMLPLSYAAIIGGCATLIGTSTNLIVNGLVAEQTIAPDLMPLKIFDFFPVGFAMMIVGYFYITFFSNRLLPEKPDLITEFSTRGREYLIEARVREKSPLIGKTIEEAGFRQQPGFYLLELWRRGYKITEFNPEFLLDRGDLLVFAGDTQLIVDMINSNSGLTLPEAGMMTKRSKTEIIEVVVSQNSNLLNISVRETNFRAKYDAAILSVHRNGEMIEGKMGEVILKAGDVLLLFAGEQFVSRTIQTEDFYFISRLREIVKTEWWKNTVLLGGLITAVFLSAIGVFSLFMSLLLLLILCLLMKITTPRSVPRSIDYNLAIIIVLSLALGTAMIKSGAAALIARGIISLFLPLGKVGLLTGIFFINSLLAAYITAKAAAAIIFPISLSTAVALGLDPMPFVLIVAYGAAANFMTPIGFQTNLMVYGPGGYSFRDFFRIGAPLTLLYMIVSVIILSLLYF